MECPICQASFPPAAITDHVNRCLEGDLSGPPTAAVPSSSPTVSSTTTTTTTTWTKTTPSGSKGMEHIYMELVDDDDHDHDNDHDHDHDDDHDHDHDDDDNAALSRMQAEALQFWEMKRKQEEEDMRLARMLEEEVSTTLAVPPQRTSSLP